MKYAPVIFAALVIVVAMGLGVYYWQQNSSLSGMDSVPSQADKTTETDNLQPSDNGVVASYLDVSSEQAFKLTDQMPEMTIIDVSFNYARGHILNSINYYAGDGSLNQAVVDFDRSRPYLVYAHTDEDSRLGSQILVEAGIRDVYRLKGNYQGWIEAGYPVIAALINDSALESGRLDAVLDQSGSGTAYVVRRSGVLAHRVQADLPDLAEGQFYEGWLVDQAPELQFFSTGKMKLLPNGSWLLEYISDQEYVGYDYVVITLETVDDGQPEDHVIEGLLKR